LVINKNSEPIPQSLIIQNPPQTPIRFPQSPIIKPPPPFNRNQCTSSNQTLPATSDSTAWLKITVCSSSYAYLQ